MVLENNKALLYLSSIGFQLYDVDGVASIHFNFPEGSVINASVVDNQRLETEIKALIAGESLEHNKGGVLTVVLAEDIIRQDLLNAVTKIFEDSGWKVEMRSLPLFEQKVITNKTLTPDLVRSILVDKIDVVTEEVEKPRAVIHVEESPQVKTETVNSPIVAKPGHTLLDEVSAEASRAKSGNLKKILFVIVLLLIGGGLIFLGFKTINKPATDDQSVEGEFTEAIVEEPSPTPTPTPTPEITIDKAEVLVKVLNGTGTPRQAAKAQKVLGELGFRKASAGNANSKDATSTTVLFSADIPASLRSKIVESLDKVFTIVEQEEDEDAKMTIVITTGPEEKIVDSE